MPRLEESAQVRVKKTICEGLEKKMVAQHQSGNLTAYIETILDQFVHGRLVTAELYEKSLQEVERLTRILGAEVRNIRAAHLNEDKSEQRSKAS